MSQESVEYIRAVRHRVESVATYEVLVQDFERIRQEASNVGTDFQFAAALLPVAFALTVTLFTATFGSERTFEIFFMVMLACYAFGIYTAVRAWRGRGSLERLMDKIASAQVGPLGDEKQVLKPSVLDHLPLEAARPQPATAVAVQQEGAAVAIEVTETIGPAKDGGDKP